MSALPWVIGGLAIGGVGLLVLRSRQAKQETAPPNPCEAISAATGIPKGVCDVGLPIVGDIIDAVGKLGAGPGDEYREKDAKNKSLNGSVKQPLESYVKSCLDTSFSKPQGSGTWFVPLWGTVLEFENGCTPFKGSPGWSKCKAGTSSMMEARSYLSRDAKRVDGVTRTVNWEMDGGPEHVMTGDRYRDGDKLIVDAASGKYIKPWSKCEFPLPIPDGGEGWVYKGRPFVVPAGAWPDFNVLDADGMPTIRGLGGVRDHRDDGASTWDVDNSPTRDQPTRTGTNETGQVTTRYAQTSTTQTTFDDCKFNPPPGYIWDAAGFCRRKRVGE